jgi:YbbR domain-containing protein
MNPTSQLRALRKAAESRIAWLSLADLGTWVLAFAVSIGLWAFVNSGQRTSERTLRIRLEAHGLPTGMVITSPVPESVEVRISGAGVILSGIDQKRLRTQLDLSGVKPGVASYTLGPELFHLPRKVDVVRITPSQVAVHIDKIERHTVSIRLARRGELADGLRLRDTDVVPDKVDVTGPAGQLEGLNAIDTETLDLGTLGDGKVDRELKLVQPGELLQLARDRVRVQLAVEPIMVQREFKQMRVDVRSEGRPWRVTPERVTVVVRGPERDIERFDLPEGSVFIDARQFRGNAPRRVKPEVELPTGFEVVRQEPAEVTVQPPRSSAPAARRGRASRGSFVERG